jgi:hypothetical protein
MKNRVSSDLIWGLLSALLIFGVLILTLWGNSNNLDPRYLFIDEQITFYPVAKILNPSGLDEFLWLISDGADYRYGRILWNAIALIAAIPAELFGVAGQIVAARELGTVLLLSSYVLLVFGFIKTPSVRFFALLILILLPYNSYYMSMPKPEPMMIFMVSLFLFLNGRGGPVPAKSKWILIGVALGAKISFLVPALILIIISVGLDVYSKKYQIKNHVLTATYIGIGFLLANPFFIQPLFFITFPILFLYLVYRLMSPGRALTLLLISALFVYHTLPNESIYDYFLKDLTKNIGLNHSLNEWIRGTFLKVNDGESSNNINFLLWFQYLCKVITKEIPLLGLIFLLNLFSFLFLLSRTLLKIGNLRKEDLLSIFILLAIGFSLLFLPMVSVKNRLWGMYFFPGLIFLTAGIFAIIDIYIQKKNDNLIIFLGFLESLKTSLLVFFLVIVSFSWIPNFINNFIFLATRNPNIYFDRFPPWLLGV